MAELKVDRRATVLTASSKRGGALNGSPAPGSTQRGGAPLLLLIDRSQDEASGIYNFLEHEAFEVRRATSDAAAVALAKWCHPDVVVLQGDADNNPLQLMRHIHSEVTVPVIIVAHQDTADLVEALECGADDYMAEPAPWPEIAARARAAVRRARRSSGSRVRRVGALELDGRARYARAGNRRLSLTPSEYNVLDLLSRTPGQVVGHDDLAGALGEPRATSVAALSQRMRRLRSKLSDAGIYEPSITAVHGVGYRLDS